MALTGSRPEALRAGSQQANSPTVANTLPTTRKIAGSGVAPSGKLDISRVTG